MNTKKLLLDSDEILEYAEYMIKNGKSTQAAVIKSLCDAISLKMKWPQESGGLSGSPEHKPTLAEFHLEQIAMHLQMFDAKRLSWREALEEISNEISEYFGTSEQ